MTRTVKLALREPTDEMEDAAAEEYNRISDWNYREQVVGTAPWQAAYDAAPDDATKALEHHLHTVRKVLNGEASLNDLGGSYDALQAREETAALIRQAEERDGDQ